MYTGIFDSHAHYNDEQFDSDREILLEKLPLLGVCGVINCGTTIGSSKESIELSEKYSYIYAACGIHPEDCANSKICELDEIKKLCSHEKCVAVGEIGLDYHYDFTPKEKQLEFFEKQLIIANELSLPVIVHSRDAIEDTLKLLKKHCPKGVLHCFSGSVETAKEILSLGMYIGLGGAVTFKNAKKPVAVAEFVPENRLLLETDCPYMSPVPFRGKRNDSSKIAFTAEFIANVRNTGVQELINTAAENTRKLFALK